MIYIWYNYIPYLARVRYNFITYVSTPIRELRLKRGSSEALIFLMYLVNTERLPTAEPLLNKLR